MVLHHLDVVNSGKSTIRSIWAGLIDYIFVLNPAHKSYYPGFPHNISIAVCGVGVSYIPLPIVLCRCRYSSRNYCHNLSRQVLTHSSVSGVQPPSGSTLGTHFDSHCNLG